MRLKKIASTILSLVCMFFLGLGIYLQKPVTAKAETPTVAVAFFEKQARIHKTH